MRTYRFHGGLRLDRPEWRLEDGELPELVNFIYQEEEVPRKRRGFSRVVFTPAQDNPVLGEYRSSVSGTNPHTLVVINGSIYRIQDHLATWDQVHTGLWPTAKPRFDTWKEQVFMVNGVDPLLSWDGSSWSEVEKAPAGCRFVQQFADRLFIGSSAQFPDKIFYSDLLDPIEWIDLETEVPNLVDISPGDDQRITGMIRTRSQLTFFKSHSTYYLWGYDPDEWRLERVADSLGCIAPDSVKEIDGHTFWLSHRGVYLDDGRNFRRIGARIHPYVRTLTRAQQSKAMAVVSGWNYILIFPDTPDGCIAFSYNLRMDNWAYLKIGVPISCVAEKDLPTDNGGWVAGSSETGFVYYADTGGTDDGKDIDAMLRLPTIGLTSPELVLMLRKIALDAVVDEKDTMTLRWQVGSHEPMEETFDGDTPQIFSGGMQSGQTISVSLSVKGSGTTSMVRGMAGLVKEKRRLWR